jgi:uncharacterized membrane protein
MNTSQRFPAFLAYFLPVIGWIYLALFHGRNKFARFHLRQSVGLFLFLILITVAWGILTWVLAWIPYAFILGIALFSLPLVAYIFGMIVWIIGMVNALSDREASLPVIGSYSDRLPF